MKIKRRYLEYLITVALFTGVFAGLTFLDGAGYATKGVALRERRRADWISGSSRALVRIATIDAAIVAALVSIAGCTYLEWRHKRTNRQVAASDQPPEPTR